MMTTSSAADPWRALFAAHHRPTVGWLAGVIRRMIPGHTNLTAREEAEECVQEAWLALAARGLCEDDKPKSLLMKIAKRAFFEVLRKRNVEQRNVLLAALRAPNVVALGWGAHLAEGLMVPASVLTDARLEAWVLRQIGLTYREIAEEMGLKHQHAAAAVVAKAKASLAA